MIPMVRDAASAAVNEALNKRSKGLTELEAALWHFAGLAPSLDPLPDKPAEAPEFAAYKDDRVKNALHAMFDGHCAYCESRYDHVAPMDVEHYRPKGGVILENGKRSKTGYYWLAANWDNLLPSCIGCNRSREQDQALGDGNIVRATSGKGNLFPLLGGTPRAAALGEEAHETPLLLDPCRDEPAKHLIYRADGYVEPHAGPDEAERPRGLATIEVCGLDRNALLERRRAAIRHLRDAMDSVLSADDDCRTHPGVAKYEERRDRKLETLADLRETLDYRALSRTLIELFDSIRARINDYFAREAEWKADRTPERRAELVAAAKALIALRNDNPVHEAFVTEMYGLADLPEDLEQ